MIVLLSYSINSSSKSLTSSTGRIEQDSITIAISDIRKANAKLIELSYEKDINKNLRQIIRNDSILAEQARQICFMEQRRFRRIGRQSKKDGCCQTIADTPRIVVKVAWNGGKNG